ncbi:hypothetical protein MTLP_06400 [Candidatus Methanoliparum sp. LAM-1]|nr:hypothetical protein MTLP_06400 [Candidatus Methanoliparum sp. LAM-1]
MLYNAVKDGDGKGLVFDLGSAPLTLLDGSTVDPAEIYGTIYRFLSIQITGERL